MECAARDRRSPSSCGTQGKFGWLAVGVALAGAALALAACPAAEDGTTMVRLSVFFQPDAGAARPSRLSLSWFDAEKGLLRDQNVPAPDKWPAPGLPLATVLMRIPDGAGSPERRAVVRAFDGTRLVASGGTRIQVETGVILDASIVLSTHVPGDEDSDGIPDELDNCPGIDDFDGCSAVVDAGGVPVGPIPASVDAGAAARVEPLAVRADAGVDRPQDAPADVAVAVPVGLADAAAPVADVATNVPAPDAGSQLVQPSEFSALATSSTSVTLAWRDGSVNELEFRIDRAVGGGAMVELRSVPADTMTFLDSAVTAATLLSYRVSVVGRDGAMLFSNLVSVTTPAGAVETKIIGKPFGTLPLAKGAEFDKAFDDDTASYFEGKDASGAYTGIDPGGAFVVTKIRYFPKPNQLARMVGGKFQGSNTSATAGYVDLHTIAGAPTAAWTTVTPTGTKAYRYLRYFGPANGYGDINEIEFRTKAP